jgi:hypothetical protein
MMGRWVAGLGVGALSLLVPMYQGVSHNPQMRWYTDPRQLKRLPVTFVVH